MSVVKTVVDQNARRYELAELLGRGGQGAVYAIKGGRLAVKLISDTSQARREKLRNQLMAVRRLPLGDLPIAKPLEILRPPDTGYIMELLTGMVPIKTLMAPPKEEVQRAAWYLRSGGLRRRLLLLGNAANILARLHAKGLAYSDPSPTNIFVSANPQAHEVWLIDADNLQYESMHHAGVFTPGFCAPELIKGTSGVTTLTDAFAFAILAFQTLALVHPYLGDMVNNGPPELEEQAFSGSLPWIDDPDDDRNRSKNGIPRERVLSPRLEKVFSRTFGLGRIEPTARPGVGEWVERLFSAADVTIRCPGCKSTYFYNQLTCPWCNGARPGFATLSFKLWDPQRGPNGALAIKPQGEKQPQVVMASCAISDHETMLITRRLAFGQSSDSINESVVSVILSGDYLKLKSLDGKIYRLFNPAGNQMTEVGDCERNIKLEENKAQWRLHFGDKNTLHRVVCFELRKGGGT